MSSDPTSPEFPEARIVDSGEIRLAVHELGDGPPLILVHGFPELAYSWRHQLPALAAAGYRAIAPDMRGMGQVMGVLMPRLKGQAEGQVVSSIVRELLQKQG